MNVTMNPMLYVGLKPTDQNKVLLKAKKTTKENILATVAYIYGISQVELISPSRKIPLPEARCICIGLILKFNQVTVMDMGKIMGKRHHSTIIYNRELFEDLFNSDKPFTRKVKQVLEAL